MREQSILAVSEGQDIPVEQDIPDEQDLPVEQKFPAVEVHEFKNLADDAYSFSYRLDNGEYKKESGRFYEVEDRRVLRITGEYSYTGDDGQLYKVSYTSDENGFRASGDHLPISIESLSFESVDRGRSSKTTIEAEAKPKLKIVDGNAITDVSTEKSGVDDDIDSVTESIKDEDILPTIEPEN